MLAGEGIREGSFLEGSFWEGGFWQRELALVWEEDKGGRVTRRREEGSRSCWRGGTGRRKDRRKIEREEQEGKEGGRREDWGNTAREEREGKEGGMREDTGNRARREGREGRKGK
jgi:hypothetical protein